MKTIITAIIGGNLFVGEIFIFAHNYYAACNGTHKVKIMLDNPIAYQWDGKEWVNPQPVQEFKTENVATPEREIDYWNDGEFHNGEWYPY